MKYTVSEYFTEFLLLIVLIENIIGRIMFLGVGAGSLVSHT